MTFGANLVNQPRSPLYVNNKPSLHIHLRDLFMYLLHIFIALNNLIISYIPVIAMYKQLNRVPIYIIICYVWCSWGLRGVCGAGAAGCLWIGGCSTVVAPRWIWSCHIWKHCLAWRSRVPVREFCMMKFTYFVCVYKC